MFKWAEIVWFFIDVATLLPILLAVTGAVSYHFVVGTCAAIYISGTVVRAGCVRAGRSFAPGST